MLSVQQCRDLIDANEQYSDKEIEEIRGTLYGLVELALDTWLEKKNSGGSFNTKDPAP